MIGKYFEVLKLSQDISQTQSVNLELAAVSPGSCPKPQRLHVDIFGFPLSINFHLVIDFLK